MVMDLAGLVVWYSDFGWLDVKTSKFGVGMTPCTMAMPCPTSRYSHAGPSSHVQKHVQKIYKRQIGHVQKFWLIERLAKG